MSCILCDIVLPELQEEIIRLKNQLKTLKHDSHGKHDSSAVRPQNGDDPSSDIRRQLGRPVGHPEGELH
jgi:hypothetical protein